MPYENEHACRLKQPSEFKEGSFRRGKRNHDGKEYSVIYGKLKGSDKMTDQAYRYNKNTWSANEARNHCKNHGGSFEAAKKSKEEGNMDETKKLQEQLNSLTKRVDALEADNQALTKANNELQSSNDSLKKANDELTLKMTIMEDKYKKAHESKIADSIMDSILSESAIPKKAHVQIRKLFGDYSRFVEEKGEFKVDSESAKAFSEYFKSEVEKIEADLSLDNSIGISQSKDGFDNNETSKYAAENDDIVKNLA